MTYKILSQSANGRAIDCTNILLGNNNYADLGDGLMSVLLHKPADQTTERVELLLSNPSKKRVDFDVAFNGQVIPIRLRSLQTKAIAFTVFGWNANDPVVKIEKEQGDELHVMGGAQS